MTNFRRFYQAFVCVAVCCVAVFSVMLPAAALDSSLVDRYASVLGTANARLPLASRRNLAERLLLLSTYYQIDPRLLLAVVSVESDWRPGAFSLAGAVGFGQLMPATAAGLKVQPLEPYENLDGTARYLRRMITRYASYEPTTRVRLAAASYNAGPYAVSRYGGVPPYRETQNYVARVLARWRHYSSLVGLPNVSDINRLAFFSKEERERTSKNPQKKVFQSKSAHIFPKPARLAVDYSSHSLVLSVIMKKKSLTSTVHHYIGFHPSQNPYVGVADISTPILNQSKVHYERSHSLFARLLGLKHRIVEPASVSGS